MSEKLDEGQALTSITLENRKWKHRRLMSYMSLYAIFVIAILLLMETPFVPQDRLALIADPIGWVVITLGGIVVAYFGFNVMEA